MSRKSRVSIAGVFALALITVLFQNCGEELDLSQYTNSSLSSSPATIVTAPQSLTFVYQSPFSVKIVARGGGLKFRWYKDGELLPNATGNTLSAPEALDAHAGTYRVEVFNELGADFREFTVAITRDGSQIPPEITTSVAALESRYSIVGGQPKYWFEDRIADLANYNVAHFSVVASGPQLTYQWYFVNSQDQATLIEGVTGDTLTFALTQENQIGTYRVIVKNPYGEVVSQAPLTARASQAPMSNEFGGNGGMVFGSRSCPLGSYGIGFNLRTGSYVDNIAIRCGNPNFTSLTSATGGQGGQPVTLTCPAGRYLIGVNIATASFVHRIQGVCGDKNGENVTQTAFAGGQGGTVSSFRCPAGHVISEIRGRSQSYVDKLQFVCSFSY